MAEPTVKEVESFQVVCSFEAGSFTVAEASELHRRKEAQAGRSHAIYTAYDDQTREVLTSIVMRSLEALHSTCGTWLPHCLIDSEGGDYIEVTMAVVMTDVAAQVTVMEDLSAWASKNLQRRIAQRLDKSTQGLEDDEFITYCRQQTALHKRLTVGEAKRLLLLTTTPNKSDSISVDLTP
jgi:hypothetical protein